MNRTGGMFGLPTYGWRFLGPNAPRCTWQFGENQPGFWEYSQTLLMEGIRSPAAMYENMEKQKTYEVQPVNRISSKPTIK